MIWRVVYYGLYYVMLSGSVPIGCHPGPVQPGYHAACVPCSSQPGSDPEEQAEVGCAVLCDQVSVAGWLSLVVRHHHRTPLLLCRSITHL